jgi:hypothetical protein
MTPINGGSSRAGSRTPRADGKQGCLVHDVPIVDCSDALFEGGIRGLCRERENRQGHGEGSSANPGTVALAFPYRRYSTK